MHTHVLRLSAAAAIALAYHASAFTISPQLGPYPVSISNVVLQTDRDDPLAPTPGTKRRLMLSVFQPQMTSFACLNASYTPYMPALTAEVMEIQEPGGVPLSPITGLAFQGLDVEYCARDRSASAEAQAPPILLFQPGYQGSRYWYQLSLAAIASSGYTVISMDSTYEAPMIEFPDGEKVVNNTGISDSGLGPNDALPVRVADFSSVIDGLESGALQIPGRSKDGEQHEAVGVFGHSIGGASALSAASTDPRISTAIDWDGQIFSSQTNISISIPTFFFGRETPLPGHLEGWEYAWDNLLRGKKAWVAVNGTQHLSFTDLPIVLDVEGLRQGNKEGVQAVGGVIAPMRQREVLWRGSIAWFDSILKGQSNDLFSDTGIEFPDVRVVKKTVL
ncbi:hypothetical protein IQ07DRAFT_588423 [Pyrenochaeta sp. DS3sAY3a]|nr:hypothetical protein IQ07DRAFT_588423 [Pyrenochaeta sp. DS3sAY3a]